MGHEVSDMSDQSHVEKGDLLSGRQSTAGVIGLGLLGSALADRLVDKGYRVYGFDTRKAKTGKVHLLENSSAVFEKCATVILCLPSSRQVADVLAEVDDSLRSNRHAIINTTTGDPDEMRQFFEMLKNRSIGYVEANVAGSSAAAREGDAILFLGGETMEIEKHQALFDALSKKSFVIGEAGVASKFKLVHNLLLGLNRAALAETLEFGKALGFDKEATLETLKQTPAFSYVMETKGARMVQENFDMPQARLSQHLKDVRLILEYAERCGALAPLSELHCRLLESLEASGYGQSDNSAIVAAFRNEQ